jgi:hypothetical protein
MGLCTGLALLGGVPGFDLSNRLHVVSFIFKEKDESIPGLGQPLDLLTERGDYILSVFVMLLVLAVFEF